ncbi:MAG: nitronate monooxygenase [Deltaproteobacteria bacterium]|nr:nitronate monooxygenase [Deltaproteobacteria bacterium]
MNEICQLLKSRYPLIQGAMGVISNPEMVAAVSDAGGYGMLASAFLTEPGPLREQIEAVKRLTDKPFGVNLMAMNPMSMTFAEILIEQGIRAVTTSAGSPKELLSILKPAGVKVLHVVPNVETALKAEDAGVDALIAEGSESGGIQGYTGASTMVLIPLVVDAVKIPVVAAGGIGDARGYRAAFALGAKGVQVGTRFIASEECIAHANYKHALCQGKETDTLLIERGKVRVRVIRTPFAEELRRGEPAASFRSSPDSLKEAWIGGDLAANTLPAGQITGMVKDVRSVREIIQEMVDQKT